MPVYLIDSESLLGSPDPGNFDAVDLGSFAQSEIETFAEIALVTPTAMDLVQQYQITGKNPHLGADTIPIRQNTSELHLKPMPG